VIYRPNRLCSACTLTTLLGACVRACLTLCAEFRFFTVNNFGVYFILFFIWGHTLVAMSFLLSVFFQKAREATSTYTSGHSLAPTTTTTNAHPSYLS
jgi:hypothetical protein